MTETLSPTEPELVRPEGFHPLRDTPSEIVSKLFLTIASEAHGNTDPYIDTSILYSRQHDMAVPTETLLRFADPEEVRSIFWAVGNLVGQSDKAGNLFPKELEKGVTEAYTEMTSSLLWAFSTLKLSEGNRFPANVIDFGSGNTVQQEEITLESALQTSRELFSTMEDLIAVVSDVDAPVERLNKQGKFGMYAIGQDKKVAATVRLLPREEFDDSIEYGGAKGTEASIGYTIELDDKPISMLKKDHGNDFTIRVDNEGDRLGFDVGAIMNKPGTLSKRVADLITLGDRMRAKHHWNNRETWHNHNRHHFPADLADEHTFAQIASKVATDLENRIRQN